MNNVTTRAASPVRIQRLISADRTRATAPVQHPLEPHQMVSDPLRITSDLERVKRGTVDRTVRTGDGTRHTPP